MNTKNNPKFQDIRKVVQIGNSFGVSIRKEVLQELGNPRFLKVEITPVEL